MRKQIYISVLPFIFVLMLIVGFRGLSSYYIHLFMYGDMRNHTNLLILLLDLRNVFENVLELKYPPGTQLLALPIFLFLNIFFDNTILNAITALSMIWIFSSFTFVYFLSSTITLLQSKKINFKSRTVVLVISTLIAFSPLFLTTSFSEGFLPAYLGVVLLVIYSYFFSRFNTDLSKMLPINLIFLFFVLFTYPLLSVSLMTITIFFWIKYYLKNKLNIRLYFSVILTTVFFLISYINYSGWSGIDAAGRFSSPIISLLVNIFVFFILLFKTNSDFLMLYVWTSIANWLLVLFNFYLSNSFSYYSLKLSWLWLILQLCLLVILSFIIYPYGSIKLYLWLSIPIFLFLTSSPYKFIDSLVSSNDWVPTVSATQLFFKLDHNVPYVFFQNGNLDFRDERIINFWTALNWKQTPNEISDWAYNQFSHDISQICNLKRSVKELQIISTNNIVC